jgi:hypothetical protein
MSIAYAIVIDNESGDKRANAVGGVIADMNELIGIAAITLRSNKCSWFKRCGRPPPPPDRPAPSAPV